MAARPWQARLLLLLLLFQRLHVDDEVQVGKLVRIVPGSVEGGDKDFVLQKIGLNHNCRVVTKKKHAGLPLRLGSQGV